MFLEEEKLRRFVNSRFNKGMIKGRRKVKDVGSSEDYRMVSMWVYINKYWLYIEIII